MFTTACYGHLGERAAAESSREKLLEPAGEYWPSLVLVDGWRAQLAPGR